jgi:1-phosphofructokinase family hexose kinase
MILTVGTSPALARTMVFDRLTLGDVNRATEVLISAAGKSINAARVTHTLGEAVVACATTGGRTGDTLREDLNRAGIRHELVPTSHPTRLCVTVVDRSAGTCTELVQEAPPLLDAESDLLWRRLLEWIPQARVVVMSGTLAPNVPPAFYALVCRLARDAGVQCIVDAKGPELLAALPYQPALVKPNRSELSSTLGRDLANEQAMRAAISDLLSQGARSVAVTAGADGVAFTDGTRSWRLRPPVIRPVSAIGSGDAFAGGFAAGLSRGLAPLDAARLAVACGAANALTLQAGFIDPAEVQRLHERVVVEDA